MSVGGRFPVRAVTRHLLQACGICVLAVFCFMQEQLVWDKSVFRWHQVNVALLRSETQSQQRGGVTCKERHWSWTSSPLQWLSVVLINEALHRETEREE